MAPQSGGKDIVAQDVAYYKGFLLYGGGSTVGWSVSGFPTSFTTGFGSTDFPAGNITVVDTTDFFVSFEFLGDQLIALFRNGAWLIQPTGSVPEFNFYRLPEPQGAVQGTFASVQTNLTELTRPSCSGRGHAYYISSAGVRTLQGGASSPISNDIGSMVQNLSIGGLQGVWNLTWDSGLDAIIAHNNKVGGLLYYPQTNSWSVFNPSFDSGTQCGFSGSLQPDLVPLAMNLNVGYWSSADHKIHAFQGAIDAQQFLATSWTWATPVVSLGDNQGGFRLRGFQLDGLNVTGATWALYGGLTPYALTQVATGTVSATDNRQLQGTKTDYPFFQFVFSGTSWAQLLGVNIYQTAIHPGR
jgi:hypothetical protein